MKMKVMKKAAKRAHYKGGFCWKASIEGGFLNDKRKGL
jgi:hypothetical protein